MLLPRKLLIFFALVIPLASGCRKETTIVNLKVKVVDSENNAIDNAKVKVEDKVVGSTNEKGLFIDNISLERGKNPCLHLKKWSQSKCLLRKTDSMSSRMN